MRVIRPLLVRRMDDERLIKVQTDVTFTWTIIYFKNTFMTCFFLFVLLIAFVVKFNFQVYLN